VPDSSWAYKAHLEIVTILEVKDKNNTIPSLAGRPRVIIELGCGNNKISKDAIGIDMVDLPGVDIVADAGLGLGFLPDECADELHAYHFLEHLDDTGLIVAEIYRILKPGGRLIGAVPHWSNPYYFSDYTHKRFFGLYSFAYFTRKQHLMRKVPSFYNSIDFRTLKMKLVFYSPFKPINAFRKVYTLIFNINSFMQEMYESSFSNIFPVHEIQFDLQKM